MDGTAAERELLQIMRQEIAVGSEQLDRPALGLLLSAMSAGLEIGFGPFMVATVVALAPVEALASRLAGFVAGTSWADYFHFLLFATLGNVVGGIVMVGALKFSHISRSSDSPAS